MICVHPPLPLGSFPSPLSPSPPTITDGANFALVFLHVRERKKVSFFGFYSFERGGTRSVFVVNVAISVSLPLGARAGGGGDPTLIVGGRWDHRSVER